MGRRQCTSEYKLGPITRHYRALLGKGPRDYIAPGTVVQFVGISTDEAMRMKPTRQKYITTRWPLIEAGMSRADCVGWLARNGYPTPPKSACVCCPFRSPAAWRRMREEAPDEFAEACALDAALREGSPRGMRGREFMHPARRPLAEAVAMEIAEIERQPDLFGNECEGMCGV